MQRYLQFIAVAAISAVLGGCALYADAFPAQPKKLGYLRPGMPRSLLLAEFGHPVRMEVRDGVRKEVFRIWHGLPRKRTEEEENMDRAKGVLNVLTMGISEGPHPPSRDGLQLLYIVTYNSEDIVTHVQRYETGAVRFTTERMLPSKKGRPAPTSTGSVK